MKRTGELLRKAREGKNLSLHEVALFLKINSRVLEAIENGDQSQLPARTFLRGFVQSYAKFLKLDAQAVLQIFSEETAPPQTTLTIPEPSSIVYTEAAPVKTEEVEPESEKKIEVDVISLEKSILTQSQVAQDKLGLKTIAVSIIGLLLVFVLYFANNVVKKYQKEALVEPIKEEVLVASTKESLAQNQTPISEAKPDSPAANAVTPEPVVSPIAVPVATIETKPKLPEKPDIKPIEKPIEKAVEKTVDKAMEKPADKPVVVAIKPAALPPPVIPKPAEVTEKPLEKKEEPKITEGKLVEVIVEANGSVEIEYSSAKTSPQKMFLKAEQIHTFKSRSGVRLKISNGGAVNIIMNGRDLGAPGAAGQPVQVTY